LNTKWPTPENTTEKSRSQPHLVEENQLSSLSKGAIVVLYILHPMQPARANKRQNFYSLCGKEADSHIPCCVNGEHLVVPLSGDEISPPTAVGGVSEET
jgi:hypothetical protein